MTFSVHELWSLALRLAGAGHFLLLAAAFQVPARLNWKQDLAGLRPINRKLLWVYGGFTAGTIIAFGTLTLLLHQELLRGDRAALALAGFIGIFWSARILVDFFYFRHSDWPAGKAFKVGHILLTALFVYLAATYIGVIVWHYIHTAA